MVDIEKIESLKEEAYIAEIDITRSMSKLFKESKKTDFYFFILCTRGECNLSSYMNNYTIKKNDLITIIPDMFLRINSQSKDCQLFIIGFNRYVIMGQNTFITILKYIPYIFKNPVLTLDKKMAQFTKESMYLLLRSRKVDSFNPPTEYYTAIFMMFVNGLGSYYSQHHIKEKFGKRSEEVIKNFIYLTTHNYSQERGLNYYAEKMNISPQHLSATIKKITGITVTDFIARIIITDAQSKLKSTDMSIQEIAFSLNFPDTSTFGKYFKRHSGISPRQYREKK